MAKDLNQCNFIGRMGKDPETKYMPSGESVVSFSIGCGDDYKDKSGNKVERTNWVRVVAFGKLGEIIAQYCKKGSKVFVSGKYVEQKWKDKNDQDRYTTQIVASEIQMLDGKPSGQSSPSQHPAASAPNASSGAPDFDDDIPF